MFLAQFKFVPGEYDEDFHALDTAIGEYAESLPGFVGVERWVSPDGLKRNSIYFFEDMETIQTFAKFPKHLEAKSQYTKWYDGYEVIISEIKHSYGDSKISSVLNEKRPEN